MDLWIKMDIWMQNIFSSAMEQGRHFGQLGKTTQQFFGRNIAKAQLKLQEELKQGLAPTWVIMSLPFIPLPTHIH